MTGIGMAAANGATVIPALAAGILYAGSATTPQHHDVTHYDGDSYADFGDYFDLSSSGGVGPVTLSYEITANVGQGFVSNPARTFFGQAGATLTTAALMTTAWGINGGAMIVGEQASVTVRCKAVDNVGTVARSPTITITFTRTA